MMEFLLFQIVKLSELFEVVSMEPQFLTAHTIPIYYTTSICGIEFLLVICLGKSKSEQIFIDENENALKLLSLSIRIFMYISNENEVIKMLNEMKVI